LQRNIILLLHNDSIKISRNCVWCPRTITFSLPSKRRQRRSSHRAV